MNKKLFIGIYLLFSFSFLFADSAKVQRKVQPGNQSKSSASKSVNKVAQSNECRDYNQVIINDTDFPVKITLLNEETHFFEEYDLTPNEIHIIPERLFVNPSRSKKIHIVTNYIYISSIKYLSPNECVYLLKATKRNPEGSIERPDIENTLDEDGDVYVINDEVVPAEEVLNANEIVIPEVEAVPEQPFVVEPIVVEPVVVEPVVPVEVPAEPAVPVESENTTEPIVPTVEPESSVIPEEPAEIVETPVVPDLPVEPVTAEETATTEETAVPSEPLVTEEPALPAEPEVNANTESLPVVEETAVIPEKTSVEAPVEMPAEPAAASIDEVPVMDEPLNNYTDSPDEELENLF